MYRTLLMAVLLVGCEAPQSESLTEPTRVTFATVNAPTKHQDWVPVSYTGFSVCTGEDVQVSGRFHVTSLVWNDGSQLRLRGQMNGNLAGVGLSTGTRFRFQQISHGTFELEWSSGIAESNDIFRFTQISQGSAPNLHITMNGTYRYDGLGGVEFIPKKWEFVCR